MPRQFCGGLTAYVRVAYLGWHNRVGVSTQRASTPRAIPDKSDVTLHVEPNLSNDAVLSNWLHLHRTNQRPMIVALEPIELAQYDASRSRDRDALVGAVSLAMDTLAASPEIVMRVDGPFFLIGFSIADPSQATEAVREVLTASTAAVKRVTNRPVRPAVAVQFPTQLTPLYEVTENAVAELVDVRARVHHDLLAS